MSILLFVRLLLIFCVSYINVNVVKWRWFCLLGNLVFFQMLLWICLGCLLATVLVYLKHVYGFFKRRGVKTPRIIPPVGTMMSVMIQKEHISENITTTYNQFPDQRYVQNCVTTEYLNHTMSSLKDKLKDIESNRKFMDCHEARFCNHLLHRYICKCHLG